MDILDRIIAAKRMQVKAAKEAISEEQLREQASLKRAGAKTHAVRDTLGVRDGINIIAEFKRRSPSKGAIRENADAATIARSYESASAAAVSVLTEEEFFGGSLDDLRAVREVVSIPILRKDFILDAYQVFESGAAGADALLLIVAALDDQTLSKLLRLSEEKLGMDALVEVHNKEEMDRAVNHGAKLIGVNNRDLRTFKVSTQTSMELARFAPANAVLVSESGLTPNEVIKLRAIGYKGFLVGEALMRAEHPERELRNFNGRE